MWLLISQLQRDDGDEELCSVYVPTNHLYIGDIFLVNSKEIIRPNMSIREGIGQLLLYFRTTLRLHIANPVSLLVLRYGHLNYLFFLLRCLWPWHFLIVLLTDLFLVFSHCIHRDHRVCGYVDAANDCSNWKDAEAEWQAPSKQIDMKKERL